MRLLLLLLGVSVVVAIASLPALDHRPARAAVSAEELLPDLDQSVPRNLQITKVGDRWRLGFDAETVNIGPTGALKIVGSRETASGDMAATQVITLSDGSTTNYRASSCTSPTPPASCSIRYVSGGGHNHWHLRDLEVFELAKLNKDKLRRDSKTGFCMAAGSPDRCRYDQPEALDVTMGLASGVGDTYPAWVDGQYIDITNVPSNEYILRQYSNPYGTIKERTSANNASSLRISLIKSKKSYSVSVLKSCPDSDYC